MKTAIVHEWFERHAGSESVVQELLRTMPQADLYALVDFLPPHERVGVMGKSVSTSFLQRMPCAKKHFRSYLPLMPLAIEQFDLADYDLVVSSNHAVAKGVLTRPDQLHVSYIHTPMRYAWDLYLSYLQNANLVRGLRSAIARIVMHYIRIWDRLAADRVDAFVANSHYVAARVAKIYHRSARVVYPPVNVSTFTCHRQKEDFYLTASRVVPYKRIDLVVDAFIKMPGRRLIVIGDGPGMDTLRMKAKGHRNVELLGYQPFNILADHLQRARAFVFAAEEDFGIIPVEAQACGTPVIAFGRGGARETVVDGHTGLFFSEQTVASLRAAVEQFECRRHVFVAEKIREHAERFCSERFRREMMHVLDQLWDRFDDARGSRVHQAAFGDPRSCDAVSAIDAGVPHIAALPPGYSPEYLEQDALPFL